MKFFWKIFLKFWRKSILVFHNFVTLTFACTQYGFDSVLPIKKIAS